MGSSLAYTEFRYEAMTLVHESKVKLLVIPGREERVWLIQDREAPKHLRRAFMELTRAAYLHVQEPTPDPWLPPEERVLLSPVTPKKVLLSQRGEELFAVWVGRNPKDVLGDGVWTLGGRVADDAFMEIVDGDGESVEVGVIANDDIEVWVAGATEHQLRVLAEVLNRGMES